MLKSLKDKVYQANLDLVKHGLVIFTWGNVSAIDEDRGLIVIKPSGIDYETMTPDNMVVIDMDGNVVEGELNPSSDTPTHIEIYKTFSEVRSVVHTHSTFATAWAQACCEMPCIGTTHADYFYGNIPCTRSMTEIEVIGEYEKQTGLVIVERFKDINPLHTPAVLVANHGPFTWGRTPNEAVHNAVVLEEIAKIASITFGINSTMDMNTHLIEKHFCRKHGENAYYGQLKNKKQ